MEWKPEVIGEPNRKSKNAESFFASEKLKKIDVGEGPVDGPARVVKSGDWGAVPDGSMKEFALESFRIPGRAQPKAEPLEVKIAEMTKASQKAEANQKRELEKAKVEGERTIKATHARAFKEGQIEGEKVAGEKFAQELQTLQNNTRGALEIFSKEKSALFLEYEGQILELVSGCIHRVFEGIATNHTEAVLPILKRAITAIGESAGVTIKVHPDDFRTVEGNQPYWLPVNAGLKEIRIVADDRINKGGCFVESDSTSVSAHAEEMADRIDEELKNIFLAKLQSLRQGIMGETSRPEVKAEADAAEGVQSPLEMIDDSDAGESAP